MEDAYEMALAEFYRSLADLDREAEELERKRARNRMAVLMLRTERGRKPVDLGSLTEAILDLVKAVDGPVLPAKILDQLTRCGFEAHSRSVSTILSRLVKAGHFKRHLEDPKGYMWAGIAKSGEGARKKRVRSPRK